MKRAPPPPSLDAAFEAASANLRGIERRRMFGYPAVFVNGNMFAGLLRGSLVMKLGDADLKRMLSLRGAKPFVAMKGRVMKQWAVAPPAMLKDPAALEHWLGKAQGYCRSLPPKKSKARKKQAP